MIRPSSNSRHSLSAGPQPPPPYRAPPPLYNNTPPPPSSGSKPYSKFNVSEPNMMPNRHTFNNENGQQAQTNLRHMLASTPKHSTLDGQGQNVMLQHLRNSGIQDKNGSYVSPDHLRDAAHRMFQRSQNERSSFGGIANASMTQQFQQAMNMSTDSAKRHSYSNQSFRKAMEQQKIPPQVPPKPRSSRVDENDHIEAELKHIMNGHQQRNNTTPPLPALSPGPGMLGMLLNPGLDSNADSSSPDTRPSRPSRLANQPPQQQNSTPGQSVSSQRPDLIGEADNQTDNQKQKKSSLTNGGLRRVSKDENLHLLNGIKNMAQGNGGLNLGMTQGALDIEKVMASVAGGGHTSNVIGETSDDNEDDDGNSTAIDIGEAATIRRQLDGLEGMYGEVLKLLGLRKFGREANVPGSGKSNGHGGSGPGGHHLRRHKMYGSMSSLPSVSSIGSRHLYSKGQKGLGGKSGDNGGQKRSSSNGPRGERSQNKRFQRLESHVVTLARSVAHLSSEVRNQQIILQEVEALRLEVQQLRQSGQNQNQMASNYPNHQSNFQAHPHQRSSFFHNPVSPAHANRVKKLTKFFGDEPPLLRLFLKNLGYEKYASVFEEAKIGMLELPYLSEDRLEKLGIPMGPRMRILQESRASLQPQMAPQHLPMNHPNNTLPSLVNTTAATTATDRKSDPNNYNVYIL